MHKLIRWFSISILLATALVACGPQEPAKIPVTGISLDRVNVSLTEGDNTILVPAITPADATDKSVTWSSSNEAVAIVTDGVVNALKAGVAVISAKTNDGGITASCTVSVDVALAALTGEVSHISCRNAAISGKVRLPKSTSADLTFGVLYSIDSGVLISNSTKIEAKSIDSDFNYSIGTGVLEPETTYYYRSYIIQNNVATYGETKSFKTLAVSSMIQTLVPTDVDAGVATLNAMLNVTDCKYENLEYGFKIVPKNGSEMLVKCENLSESVFSTVIETVPLTEYSTTAWVSLDDRTYMGENLGFSSTAIQANVVLNNVNDVTELKATIAGQVKVTSNGTFSRSAKLYYGEKSTFSGLKSSGQVLNLSLAEDGSFTQQLTNLTPGTKYYYAVEAMVGDYTFTSTVKNFSSRAIQATVTLNDAQDVTSIKATITGKLTVKTRESFTQSAILFYGETNNLADLKTTGTAVPLIIDSESNITQQLTNLKPGTIYYCVLQAQVGEVVFTSSIKPFTTLPGIILNDAVDITEFRATITGKLALKSSSWARLYYSETDNSIEALKSAGSWTSLYREYDGTSFRTSLVNLSPGQTYYYFVQERDGDDYLDSELKRFSTIDIMAEVTTNTASNVGYTTATLNGSLSVNSFVDKNITMNKRLWFIYSDTASTIANLISSGARQLASLSGDCFSFDITGLKDNETYYYAACAEINGRIFYGTVCSLTTKLLPAGTIDMGVSVFWHQCNLGASRPEEYGDYYAWGETETKQLYDWTTYSLCTGTENTLTKYTSAFLEAADGKTILERVDDAAAQKMGGNWRIPTLLEWQELRDSCTAVVTQVNGVEGCLVTSKKTAQSIFFPFAGYREVDQLLNLGQQGRYWSSDVHFWNIDYGRYCSFDLSHPYFSTGFSQRRCNGLSIRPVCDY